MAEARRDVFSHLEVWQREKKIIADAWSIALQYKAPCRTMHQSGISGAMEVTSVDSVLKMVCSQMFSLPDARSGSCGVASVCAKFSLFTFVGLDQARDKEQCHLTVYVIYLSAVEMDELNPDWAVVSKTGVCNALGGGVRTPPQPWWAAPSFWVVCKGMEQRAMSWVVFRTVLYFSKRFTCLKVC